MGMENWQAASLIYHTYGTKGDTERKLKQENRWTVQMPKYKGHCGVRTNGRGQKAKTMLTIVKCKEDVEKIF